MCKRIYRTYRVIPGQDEVERIDTIGCEEIYQLVKDKEIKDRYRIEIEESLRSCPYCHPERLNPEGILKILPILSA